MYLMYICKAMQMIFWINWARELFKYSVILAGRDIYYVDYIVKSTLCVWGVEGGGRMFNFYIRKR